MVSEVGVPLVEAVAMATLVPANILGLEKSLGSLSLGKVADLIRFNSKWNMKGIWVGGSEFFL
jgi:N-acetylglucosamine-6-phosphate deacetylase